MELDRNELPPRQADRPTHGHTGGRMPLTFPLLGDRTQIGSEIAATAKRRSVDRDDEFQPDGIFVGPS